MVLRLELSKKQLMNKNIYKDIHHAIFQVMIKQDIIQMITLIKSYLE